MIGRKTTPRSGRQISSRWSNCAIVAAACCAGTALAAFNGSYAPGNWSLSAGAGDGFATNDGSTLVLNGNGNAAAAVDTDYTIAAAATGVWSFDWSYASTDSGTFDSGGYVLNGVYTVLAFNNSQGSGSSSIPVTSGDVIGFRVFSVDGCCGDGILTITNFSAPEAAGATSLSLESESCQDDVSAAPGHQIAVELWMRNLTSNATGYQAFVEFDDVVLDFRADLSSYTGSPFPLHIPLAIVSGPGSITLNGSDMLGGSGTNDDSLLATLVFDVDDQCATTSVNFETSGPFPSELSFEGVAIPTALQNTGDLALDDTDPVIACPSSITVAADVEVPICDISDCCVAHPGVACSNSGCTAIVCGDDPFCCDTAWDNICAGEASSLCPPTSCAGAYVTFASTATDNCTASPNVVSIPPSGSFFPIGTTSVSSTATDDCGNTDSCRFNVNVTPTNLITITATLPGSLPSNRCVNFVMDDCNVQTHVTLSFIDHDANGATPVQATETIEVDCGSWTSICAKDEQHTLWSSSSLSVSGVQYAADSELALDAGDTDNDGDVDINDVTWLVFTFGDFDAPGGCPWDGTRDADFNNGGAVGAEDYTLLSDQWLALTSCGCVGAAMEQPIVTKIRARDLHPQVANGVDRNRDGWFDFKDVMIFEIEHGLPETLSRTMSRKN